MVQRIDFFWKDNQNWQIISQISKEKEKTQINENIKKRKT